MEQAPRLDERQTHADVACKMADALRGINGELNSCVRGRWRTDGCDKTATPGAAKCCTAGGLGKDDQPPPDATRGSSQMERLWLTIDELSG